MKVPHISERVAVKAIAPPRPDTFTVIRETRNPYRFILAAFSFGLIAGAGMSDWVAYPLAGLILVGVALSMWRAR